MRGGKAAARYRVWPEDRSATNRAWRQGASRFSTETPSRRSASATFDRRRLLAILEQLQSRETPARRTPDFATRKRSR
jgi:hypothetical protein